jgi:transcriptional regulator with XRE-family HTH domain
MMINNPLKIRGLREQKGLSLNALARKAKVSTNTLFRLENGRGKRGPSEKTVKKIADVLAVTVHELAGVDTDKEIRESRPLYQSSDGNSSESLTILIPKVIEILESKGVYSQALVASINAFLWAVRLEKR